MSHRLLRLHNPYYVIPFEIGAAVYVIFNGLLTLNVDSVVLQNLHTLLGMLAFAIPFLQIIAGTYIIIGVGRQKANWEAGGLYLMMSIFLVRAIALTMDGSVTLNDVNALGIATIIMAAGIFRLNRILIVNRLLKTGEIK